MKNHFAFLGLAILVIFTSSCKDKNNTGAITPDYGATGNPYPDNQTVTGTTTYTSPATQNTTFDAGGIGWSNPSCVSTSSMGLRATKDNVDVILLFSPAAKTGTYSIGGTAAVNVCALTIANAPNQPAGVFWYGKSGTVEVTVTATSITAKLVNVVCTQKDFNFPQVSVTGVLACAGQ